MIIGCSTRLNQNKKSKNAKYNKESFNSKKCLLAAWALTKSTTSETQMTCGRINVTTTYWQHLCLDWIKESKGPPHGGKKSKTYI